MVMAPFLFLFLLNVSELPPRRSEGYGEKKMTQNSVAVTIFYPEMCRDRQSSEVIQRRVQFIYI